MAMASTAPSVRVFAARDAPALACRVAARRGRRDDARPPAGIDGGDARLGLAASASVLQFARGTPPSWSLAGRGGAHQSEMPRKTPKEMRRASARATESLADWAAKLLVLPLVGASLCGALTLLLGVQWVEAVRREGRADSSCGAAVAALWALLPALSLLDVDAGDADNAVAGDNGGDGHHARSPSARPVKRQRSGDNARDASEPVPDDALVPRQPKPRSPLTSVSPRPAGSLGSRRRRRRRRVFIWDLDETLVLFASLYTGSFAQTHGKEVAPGVALGEQMMTFLLAMLERHFFFGDLHDTDVDHISCAEGDRCPNCRRLRAATAAASSSSSPPLVFQESGDQQEEAEDARERERKTRYRRIRDIYEQRGHVDFLHDDQSEWFAVRAALVQAIDAFSTGWLQEARQVLALIEAANTSSSGRMLRNPSTVTLGSEQGEEEEEEEDGSALDREEEEEEQEGEVEVENVNVLVTNTQLVPALCKCLVYELDAFFSIERVYSSAKVHKYRCFEAIMAKYRAEASEDVDEDVAVEFVAIGDGLEEEQVSLALGLEFHKIRSLADLRRLRYDLQLVDRAPPSPFASLSSPVARTDASSSRTPTAMPTMAVAVDTQEQ